MPEVTKSSGISRIVKQSSVPARDFFAKSVSIFLERKVVRFHNFLKCEDIHYINLI